MSSNLVYSAQDYGPEEVKMMSRFHMQLLDSKFYFLNVIKPRLDRAYKLYAAYNGDRALEIKKWQANIFVPYIQSVIETMMPRILDARPELGVQGRNEEDQEKAPKIKMLMDFTWEISKGDAFLEELTRAAMVYGLGFAQVGWKKDVRKQKFLNTKDPNAKKLEWKEKSVTYYDAPFIESVDNYALWYDWHNIKRESKQYWLKRKVLTGLEIKRLYPNLDKDRLECALRTYSGDLADYSSIRQQVKTAHYTINKGSDYRSSSGTISYGINNVGSIYMNQLDPDLRMHELFEWWRPYDDAFSVVINWVPCVKGGAMPIPYDFKEAPFIDVPYLRFPHEFEAMGLPLILENPQIMLNMIKNQRLDAATLGIHKMWIVNPLANINKQELVTKPFGIIYSTDPNGVKEVQFSDIKSSAYQEEEMLKQDMRYASGVDDFSMGVGGGGASATEVRHLRESTLERVRLFVNHLGDGLSIATRWWLSMYSQFFTKKMTLRIIGEDGKTMFPLIEEDDVNGSFDFKCTVLPSIAGQNDINKKQGMDLFQLLINLPFVDPQKLTNKVLKYWDWNLESIKSEEGAVPPGGAPGMPGTTPEGMPPELAAMMGGAGAGSPEAGAPAGEYNAPMPLNGIPPDVAKQVLAALGAPNVPLAGEGMGEAGNPINLLATDAGQPPTVKGVDKGAGGGPGPGSKRFTGNPRGFNMGGKVNTNTNINHNSSPESSLMKDVNNLQR